MVGELSSTDHGVQLQAVLVLTALSCSDKISGAIPAVGGIVALIPLLTSPYMEIQVLSFIDVPKAKLSFANSNQHLHISIFRSTQCAHLQICAAVLYAVKVFTLGKEFPIWHPCSPGRMRPCVSSRCSC